MAAGRADEGGRDLDHQRHALAAAHQQIEETGEAEAACVMNSISGQLMRLSVVPMESTIPPEMTIQEWRRSAEVVPLRPVGGENAVLRAPLRAACRKPLGPGRLTYERNA
jgi:hypothetical protein